MIVSIHTVPNYDQLKRRRHVEKTPKLFRLNPSRRSAHEQAHIRCEPSPFSSHLRRFCRGCPPFFVSHAYAAWPDRPVKLVVPFAPGGPVDVIARLLQPLLAEELKANFFIENKPGAAGSIGVGQVARADPDGYTVLVTSNTIMINPLLYKSVPYDLEKDFIPLADMAGSPTAFAVNPKSGMKTVADFVAFAKEKKGAVNYGSAGFATPSHLAGEFFKNRAGIEMTQVPFNGAGPANQALLGG